MTISEVCRQYGLTPDTLRYYEKAGLLPSVTRTSGGIRNYTEHDCNWIGFIKCMRNAGVQVDALVEYVRLFEEGESTAEVRKQLLIRERDRIAAQVEEMQNTLERLNRKIEEYGRVMMAEKELRLAANK
jgi:DNA-binding transcriptional MerR regulator